MEASPLQNFVSSFSQNSAESDSKPISVPESDCKQDFECYYNYYTGLVEQYGVAPAFTELKKQAAEDPYVEAQCHQMAHVIGRAAASLYEDAAEAYIYGDSFCWSGYYHGVMEGVLKQWGAENFSSKLGEVCQNIKGRENYSFDYFNCVHGLGHGIMDFTENKLFDSLAMCDNLTGSWEQNSCYGGAFMENVMTDNRNHFTEYLKKDDLLYPCTAVDYKYKGQCYLMQTSYVLKENGGDFIGAFALCKRADTDFVDTCYQSLGRDASSRNNYKVEGTRDTCLLGEAGKPQENCIVGAVKDIVSYFHSDKEANRFCSLFSPDLENLCSTTLKSYYRSF